MHSIKAKITTMTVVAIVIATVIATTLGVIAIQSIGTSSSEQVLRLLCETSQRNISGGSRQAISTTENIPTTVT